MDIVILIQAYLKNLAQNFLPNFLPIIIFSNLSSILINKIRLQKMSKYDGGVIKDCPFIDSASLEERKKEIDEEKIKHLLPIVEKLKDYTSEENLRTAYRNLSSIKIRKNPLTLVLGFTGAYYSDKNKIVYSLNSSVGHEFLHLASAYHDHENEESYVGFDQQKGLAIIGRGLNEGYTELLASRIYNKKNKVTCYEKEAKIARLLELFFDNPKDMENFYFNHDLPAFIHHMEQFAPRQDVINLVLGIDSINLLSRGFGNPFPTYNSIKTQIILYNWFAAKNKNPEKLQQFKDLVCKNKMASMIINKQKMKLYRESPYIMQSQSIIPKEHKPKR